MKTFIQMLEDLSTLRRNAEIQPHAERTGDIEERISQVQGMGGSVNITAQFNLPEKSIAFVGNVRGAVGGAYKTGIKFLNVKFKEVPEQMTFGNFFIKNPKTGEKYYFSLLGARGQDVKIRCTCPHFTARLSPAVKLHGAYIENGEIKNWSWDKEGPRLPGIEEARQQSRLSYDTPQACKHILTLGEYLEDKGVLTTHAGLADLFDPQEPPDWVV